MEQGKNSYDEWTQGDAIAVWENEGGACRRAPEKRNEHDQAQDASRPWAVYRVSADIGGRLGIGLSRIFAAGSIRSLTLREVAGHKRRRLRRTTHGKVAAME
jgi:hypothetical protein